MLKDRRPAAGYWRSVGSVLTGTALAQGLTVSASLVLARVYAPAEFGAYAMWLSVVVVVGVVATGRFETALAVVPDGEARENAVVGTLVTAVAFGLLGTLFIWVVRCVTPRLLGGLPDPMLVLLMPTSVGLAFSQTWQAWAAADGRYRTLSALRVSQAAGVAGVQVVAGLMVASASMLAIGQLVGILIGLVVGQLAMPLRVGSFRSIGQHTRILWTEHRRFPLLSLPADAVNSVSAQLPMLIVTARWGPGAAGHLAMATRVLGGPTALLGKSVLDVFKRHASEAYRKRGNCRAEYLHSLRTLSVGSLVFCALFAIVGESVVVGLLGVDWQLTGKIAVWLLPLYALRFMASPLSYVVYIAGKQHIDLIWQVVLLGSTALSLFIWESLAGSLQSYSVTYAGMYGVYLWMSYRFSMGNGGKASERY